MNKYYPKNRIYRSHFRTNVTNKSITSKCEHAVAVGHAGSGVTICCCLAPKVLVTTVITSQ